MGVFDRLANVAKGKAKILARDAKDAFDDLTSGSGPDDEAPHPEPPRRASSKQSAEELLELLERLKADAMIDEDKYAAKKAELLAKLDGTAPPTEGRRKHTDLVPEVLPPDEVAETEAFEAGADVADAEVVGPDKPLKRTL